MSSGPSPGRVRRTPEQYRQALLEEAAEISDRYGVTPEEILMFLDDVPALRKKVRAEAAEQAFEVHGLLDRSGLGSFAIPDPRDAAAGERVYYDWFKNLHVKEQARLRQNGWIERGARNSADDWDDALALQFGGESTYAPGQALELHWLRLNRDYDLLRQAARGRRPRTYDRYGGKPDYNRLLPKMNGEGYDLNVVVGGSDIEAAAMLAQKELLGASDEAAALLRDAEMAVNGPPPWRMSFQSWEEEVRTLEYERREFGLSRIDEERYRELVPSLVDKGQDYEDLYATIIETARFARFEVADYATIPWG